MIIPRVFDDGCAAQFRVNAVPGQSMLSLYKQKRAREHMFVLRGRLSVLDQVRAKPERPNTNARTRTPEPVRTRTLARTRALIKRLSVLDQRALVELRHR